MRKSTMVEFVDELEKLMKSHPDGRIKVELGEMICEAKAGEYHDYKNNKYTCGKVESSRRLRSLGFIPLAIRIENGEFDEQADEQDKAMMRKSALEGGFSETQIKRLFKL